MYMYGNEIYLQFCIVLNFTEYEIYIKRKDINKN